jgi:hypothetical protein
MSFVYYDAFYVLKKLRLVVSRFHALITKLLQFGKLEYTEQWKAEAIKAKEDGGYLTPEGVLNPTRH